MDHPLQERSSRDAQGGRGLFVGALVGGIGRAVRRLDREAATLARPDRRDEPYRFGSLGGVRQWVEAIFDTLKDQFGLERHGARTVQGAWIRVAQRLLALAADVWFNWQLGAGQALPGRLRPLISPTNRHQSSRGIPVDVVVEDATRPPEAGLGLGPGSLEGVHPNAAKASTSRPTQANSLVTTASIMRL